LGRVVLDRDGERRPPVRGGRRRRCLVSRLRESGQDFLAVLFLAVDFLAGEDF
jgi:hypothetical protein